MVPYKQLPKDGSNNVMQEFATPFKAVARYTSENATASSVITLNDNTTTVEVAALGQGVAIRWVPTSDTQASVVTIAGATSNYDNVVAPNTVRRFAVPIESFVAQTSIVGLNKQYGLYNRIAVKTFGIGSVMTTEY